MRKVDIALQKGISGEKTQTSNIPTLFLGTNVKERKTPEHPLKQVFKS